jgi:hypothetical protein
MSVVTTPARVTALLLTLARPDPCRGQRDRELESGDTGDTRPRSLSPKITLLFAGQTLSGDTGDTFERQDLDELRAVDGAGWRKPRGSLGYEKSAYRAAACLSF